MVVTADPPESIRQLLYDNWSLQGKLSKTSIGAEAFNTGIPAPSRRYPSIEVLPLDGSNIVRTLEWWQKNPLVWIHVWERPGTAEQNALQNAKNNRRYLVQEVYRIIHGNQTKAEDLVFIHPEDEINADQYHALEYEPGESSKPVQKGAFPILHSIIPVRGIQWHNSVAGGMAVNRS